MELRLNLTGLASTDSRLFVSAFSVPLTVETAYEGDPWLTLQRPFNPDRNNLYAGLTPEEVTPFTYAISLTLELNPSDSIEFLSSAQYESRFSWTRTSDTLRGRLAPRDLELVEARARQIREERLFAVEGSPFMLETLPEVIGQTRDAIVAIAEDPRGLLLLLAVPTGRFLMKFWGAAEDRIGDSFGDLIKAYIDAIPRPARHRARPADQPRKHDDHEDRGYL